FRKQTYDYEAALAQAPPDHRDALIVMTSPTLVSDRSQLSEFAIKHRMLSMGAAREYADAGCLLTYGAHFAEMYARAADYIDRLAKGTSPADLPIEQPTKFELLVNLKTAKAYQLLRVLRRGSGMSALAQKQTFALQQPTSQSNIDGLEGRPERVV